MDDGSSNSSSVPSTMPAKWRIPATVFSTAYATSCTGCPGSPHTHTKIRLNQAFWSDFAWWRIFMADWNGVSFLPPPAALNQLEPCQAPQPHEPDTSDGSWGCGAWHGSSWFQLQWDDCSAFPSILVKELLPIVFACAVWGPAWSNHQVVCHCDNQALVACLCSRST